MIKQGDKAPPFEAEDQNGNIVRLSNFVGKKVVLYFYPKDDTPGCTKQACNLRDHYSELQNEGYEVLGVSPDTAQKHQKFISKYDLPFRLLVDKDLKMHEDYNTWREKKMWGKKYMGTIRTTFLIDEQGKIQKIIEKVKTGEHTSQIIE